MNRIPVSDPDFLDIRDKINRIPPPPLVPFRPRLVWTRRRCPNCNNMRNMPEEHDKCGECLDVEDRLKSKPRVKRGKAGKNRDPRTRYLDQMNRIRVEKGVTFPELRRRIARSHDDTIRVNYLQKVSGTYDRASYERMVVIAEALGCQVDDLYTDEYNRRRDQQNNDRR